MNTYKRNIPVTIIPCYSIYEYRTLQISQSYIDGAVSPCVAMIYRVDSRRHPGSM